MAVGSVVGLLQPLPFCCAGQSCIGQPWRPVIPSSRALLVRAKRTRSNSRSARMVQLLGYETNESIQLPGSPELCAPERRETRLGSCCEPVSVVLSCVV